MVQEDFFACFANNSSGELPVSKQHAFRQEDNAVRFPFTGYRSIFPPKEQPPVRTPLASEKWGTCFKKVTATAKTVECATMIVRRGYYQFHIFSVSR